MPPTENKNPNNQSFEPIKVGIDPVFKGTNSYQNIPGQSPVTPIGGAFGVLNNQRYNPSQSPITLGVKEPSTTSAVPKSIVRTFKGDIESAIENNHLNSINIALAEKEKMRGEIKAAEGEVGEESSTAAAKNGYSKSKIAVFLSVILIIAGAAGLTLLYLTKKQDSIPVSQTQELPSLITAEYKDEIDTSRIAKDKFAAALSSKLNDTVIPTDNLYNLYVTAASGTEKRLLTSTEFTTLLGFKIPDIVKRSLEPDFMVGMYYVDKSLPFVILKTSYFENAFAGMLSWETSLERDFRLLFELPGYENANTLETTLATAEQDKFEDTVIVNKDVRQLRDATGNVILLYSIVDKETIIITVNDIAFKEIINRLNKEKGMQR